MSWAKIQQSGVWTRRDDPYFLLVYPEPKVKGLEVSISWAYKIYKMHAVVGKEVCIETSPVPYESGSAAKAAVYQALKKIRKKVNTC